MDTTPAFPTLRVVSHPLVQHKLSLPRDRATPTKIFKELVDEIATLIAYEATSELTLESAPVETPLERTTGKRVSGKKLTLVPILRAGLGNDARLEALWEEWQAGHRTAVSRVARHLAAAGQLRPGLDDARAADVLYVLAGSETYRQLVVERGWDPAWFEEWLAESARRLLLSEPRPESHSESG